MDKRKEEERAEFLRLSPLERIRTMDRIFREIVSLRARSEGVAEYEIYRRYLKNNPRHYERSPR